MSGRYFGGTYLQPSLLKVLLSSQASEPSTKPSPHLAAQIEGSLEHVNPKSQTPILEFSENFL